MSELDQSIRTDQSPELDQGVRTDSGARIEQGARTDQAPSSTKVCTPTKVRARPRHAQRPMSKLDQSVRTLTSMRLMQISENATQKSLRTDPKNDDGWRQERTGVEPDPLSSPATPVNPG